MLLDFLLTHALGSRLVALLLPQGKDLVILSQALDQLGLQLTRIWILEVVVMRGAHAAHGAAMEPI